MIGEPELLDDERFKDDLGRGDNGEALSAYMGAWCADRTTAECLAEMEAQQGAGRPRAVARRSCSTCPTSARSACSSDVEYPTAADAGTARRVPGGAVGVARGDPRPGAAARRAHRRGPGRLGYDGAAIARLRGAGVVIRSRRTIAWRTRASTPPCSSSVPDRPGSCWRRSSCGGASRAS